MTFAFSEQMALESVPESLKDCDPAELIIYARTVAYKTFHNIHNGYPMEQANDPLTVGDKPAGVVWKDHYAV